MMGCIRHIRREMCKYNIIFGRIQILLVILSILFDIGRLTLNDGEVKVDTFD